MASWITSWTARMLLFAAVTSVVAPFAVANDPGPATGAFERRLTPVEIAGAATAAQMADVIAADEAISYELFVPPTYDPARPPGVFVYISPTYTGEMPVGYDTVMTERNLVWIAANRSGNNERVARRKLLALLAPYAVARHYAIDFNRVYVSGFSGGGKAASRVAVDYAELFKGAVFICGVDFWDVDEPPKLGLIRENRYVFLTGTWDQALEPTKDAHERFRSAGVTNTKLMVIDNMTHRTPRRIDFDEAIRFLDALPQ